MKALFIHGNDMTEWRVIPDEYRGRDFLIRDVRADHHHAIQYQPPADEKAITFRWRTQFARGNGRVLFDVFEEV